MPQTTPRRSSAFARTRVATDSTLLLGQRSNYEFARSTVVARGRDRFAELLVGVTWQFMERCAVRTQWSYTRNESNIDIFDYDRNEVSTAVRCDLF